MTRQMSRCNNCTLPIESQDTVNHSHLLCNPCSTLSERASPIRLTPMTEADLELVLAWRSNPKIYRHFRWQDSPLNWESHVSWYESRAEDRHDFIIEYGGRRIGVVSISTSEKVSIYLGDFAVHGQGVATAALRWLCNRFENRTPLIAEVHEANEPSKQLFKGCGFQQQGRDDGWLRYTYES